MHAHPVEGFTNFAQAQAPLSKAASYLHGVLFVGVRD
jgi:hypothetical protein